MQTSQIILLIGSTAAIVAAIINGISTYFSNRYTSRWKETADRGIASLQSELSKSNNLLNHLLSGYGSNYQQAQNRRIKAIEVLWNNLLLFKNIIPSIGHLIYNILTEEEIIDYVRREKERNPYGSLSLIRANEDENFKKCLAFTEIIEIEKPFISEQTWFFYQLYKIFVSRISYFLIEDAKKQSFKHWHNDKVIRDLLERSLGKEEFNYLYSQKMRSLEITLAFLENKLLQEINKTLTGDDFTTGAVERFKKFEQIIKAVPDSK